MIKEILSGWFKRLNGNEKKFASDVISGFVSTGDLYGKMQPNDYTTHVMANEGWVYACVNAIAEGCADSQLKLYTKKGDKEEEVKSHIFLDLMKNVNPFMNGTELRIITETFLLLTGNCYWFLNKDGLGIPREIWVIPSQDMKIVPSKTNFVEGYIYQPNSTEPRAFVVDEIIHFKYPNPADMFYGMGPLTAAAYQSDTEKYMNQYQAALFKNDARVSFVLESDQQINPDEASKIRAMWRQLYAGASKAGNFGILGKGLSYKNISLTNQELAFVSSKNINRDTILGIFRVPKSVLGLVEDVNRANAEASEYTFAKRNLSPKIKLFVDKLNEQLLPLYKQSGGNALFIKSTEVIPLNRELLILERNARLDKGLSTINEEREAEGKKPVEWGDVPIMPMSMIAFGSDPYGRDEVQAEETPAEEPAKEPAKEPKKSKSFDAIQKARIWHEYKAVTSKRIDLMEKKLQGLFAKQRTEVLKNLNKVMGDKAKSDIERILFELEYWEKEFADECEPIVKEGYKSGVDRGRKLISSTVSFNLQNPATMEYLNDKLFKFSFETNDTTLKQLRSELQKGLDLGEGSAKLGERINEVFDFAEKYRGVRIARTELGDAENKGTLDMWEKDGGVEKKEWLHGGGGETPRANHVAMNGEQVAINEPFSNGLMYACDTHGEPGEIINCTCTILPIQK